MNRLDDILMLDLPKDKIGNIFSGLDSDIPLPVQIPDLQNKENFKIKDLTPEMILAGMFVVFAYDRQNIHIEYYRKIFNLLRPKIRNEMTDAAIIKTKNGDYDKAEEILLALEGLNPADGITKLNLALLMEDRASFYEDADLFDEARLYNDKAEELYQNLILFEPPIPEVFFNAGYFFAKQKKYSRVKSLLSTYLKIETSKTKTAKFRKEKAENFVNLISSQGLDDELFSAAYNLINEGKEGEACDKMKLFLQKNPKAWNAWFLLGWALRRQERWEDANASFLQALSLLDKINNKESEPYVNIYNELAICNMELQKFSNAEKYLLEALEYAPESIKIISNLGTLALKQNRRDVAEAFFRTVLEINPHDRVAKQVLGIA